MDRRVVVTGMGAVTPLGIGVDPFWEGIKSGKPGVGPITLFDASDYASQIAGEVKGFDPLQFLDKRGAKRMDRFVQFGAVAAIMALQDSGLEINESNEDQVGVLVGSGVGGIRTWEEQHEILLAKGPSRVSPLLVPMMIGDMASGHISILLNAKGPNSAIQTACASGTHAAGEAFHIIKRGDADAMITGGAEAAVVPTALAGFCSMKALSTRNDEPEKASRPFERDRDGFVIGEGAGILILEDLAHAQDRGARIYGEVVGYGMSGDAHHITASDPEGDGAARAMAAALNSGGISPGEVDYINAHGTSTQLNDRSETLSIKIVFGEQAYQVPVSSTKSMTGHLLGAAGGIELIICFLAIRDSILPPTINYENPDPECDLDYVPNQAREKPIEVAMSNSFGFGGHNAVLVVRRFSA